MCIRALREDNFIVDRTILRSSRLTMTTKRKKLNYVFKPNTFSNGKAG